MKGDMMLDSLRSPEDPDEQPDIGFTIDSATNIGGDLVLRVRVRAPNAPGHPHSIVCRQPRDYRVLAAEWADTLDVFASHAVLWPYCQPRVALYFRGRPKNPSGLFGELVASHYEAVGEWLPFKKFINGMVFHPSWASGTSESGILADGPEELIKRYSFILQSHGVECSLVPGSEPRWWDGERWTPETETLYALVIGDSYVVSPYFCEEATEPGGAVEGP